MLRATVPLDGGPEWWAGVECTVNRVGDRYADQLRRSGHHERASDLDLLAALGVRALRYPVLWERHAPDGVERADWRWSDARLHRLRALGLRPVVGLLHHGSGPRHTSLIDPGFPAQLAAYARACAERYPWVRDWTPVNEPLTTARFSGLYGHWYPHGTNEATFHRALLHQVQGTILAMEAIRSVIPEARLVQTEDLGRTWSTPRLAYQAAFDNERRWLSLDLLTGRVTPDHPLARFLLDRGVSEAELAWLREHPCPPQVLGINHYLTSERYLDERLERFPPATHGGNGRDAYADVEAVRACAILGPQGILREAWQRYRLPLAVTEVHLHCTREEQLRWLLEVWRAGCALRAEGIPFLAITAWAAFGSYDWTSLLTRDDGTYEAGLFDLRGGSPRPTAAAALVRSLAHGQEPRHPLLAVPGWWRRSVRLLYPSDEPLHHEAVPASLPPLLITGNGALGRAFARHCARRGIPYRVTGREELDLADPAAVAAALDRDRPWAVVNAAGFARVGEAERDPERCWRDNLQGPVQLARAAAARSLPFVTFSSHLVFDGQAQRPYVESDEPSPLNVYGRCKCEAENAILAAHPRPLLIRSAAFFSPWEENLATRVLRALAAGRSWQVHDGIVQSPTYLPDLVDTVLDLLIDGEHGLWHLANAGTISLPGFARLIATTAGLDERLVQPTPPPPYLPRFSALTSERSVLLPSLETAIARFHQERAAQVEAPDPTGLPSTAPP